MPALCRKWKKVQKGLPESQKAFDAINEGADPLDIATWTSQESKAQEARTADVNALDIYDVMEKKPITRAEIQLQLTEKENKGNSAKGVASWLSVGLKFEEAQWVN